MFVELAFYRFIHVLSAIEVHIGMQRSLLNLTTLKKTAAYQAITRKCLRLPFVD